MKLHEQKGLKRLIGKLNFIRIRHKFNVGYKRKLADMADKIKEGSISFMFINIIRSRNVNGY